MHFVNIMLLIEIVVRFYEKFNIKKVKLIKREDACSGRIVQKQKTAL